MNEFLLVGIVILAFILITILIRLLSGIVRTVVTVSFIAAVVVFGILLVNDISDVQKNLPTADKVYVLEMQNNVVAAFSVGKTGIPSITTDLASVQEMLDTKDYDALKGNARWLLVYDWKAFDSVDAVTAGQFSLSHSQIESMLTAPSATGWLAENYVPGVGSDIASSIIKQIFPTDEYAKGIAFVLSIQQGGPKEFMESVSDGTLIVHPDSLTFKLIRILPQSLLEKSLPMLEVEHSA